MWEPAPTRSRRGQALVLRSISDREAAADSESVMMTCDGDHVYVKAAIDCLRRYVKVVCEVFGKQYLRPPNEDDTIRLLNIDDRRGFSGMLSSIDCMH
jgi:hypothetical protein